jgi:hypothetical protein
VISQRGLDLLGFLTLLLVFVNMFLMVGNQSLQRVVAEFKKRGLKVGADAKAGAPAEK